MTTRASMNKRQKQRVYLWSPSVDSDTSSTNAGCCNPRPSSTTPQKSLIPQSNQKIKQFLENKRLGSLDIFFRDTEAIELGDVAHGWIELSLERPALITSMCISFYGEAVFHLFGQLHTRQFEMRKYELWKMLETTNVQVMEPGFYVYEFFVGTHTALPVPFDGKGAVRSLIYYCEVCAVECFYDDQQKYIPIDHIKRKVLELKPKACIPADYGLPLEPVSENGFMYVRNILDYSGTIVLTATLLDGRRYRPGENVRFKVEILNCFRRLKIDVALVQKAKACVDDSFVAVELDVVKIRLGKLSASDTYKRYTNLALWIPDPAIAPVHVGLIYANRLVQLGYSFLVMATTWTDRKLIVEIPLIVRYSNHFMANEKNYATL